MSKDPIDLYQINFSQQPEPHYYGLCTYLYCMEPTRGSSAVRSYLAGTQTYISLPFSAEVNTCSGIMEGSDMIPSGVVTVYVSTRRTEMSKLFHTAE